VLVMSAGLYALLWLMDGGFEPGLLKAIFLIYVQLALLVAVTLFFSTFTSSTLAGLFTGFIYVAGHFSAELKHFETVVESDFLPYLTRAVYFLLPNFRNFDVKSAVVAGDPVSMAQIVWAALYGAAYVALLLVASSLVFQRKNLK
jgi:hypothetical protein